MIYNVLGIIAIIIAGVIAWGSSHGKYFTESQKILGFPVAIYGGDGIRASRNQEDDGFKIWFINSFDDPENPKRKEITTKLIEGGFEVS